MYASISAYGQTGPLRDYPGFDPVAQAMGGMTAVTGLPDYPTRCGVSIADFSSGFFAAFSVVSALFHKMKTGEGQTIDISMQECIWPPRLGNRHSAMIPCNLYPTQNGHLFIMAGVLSQLRNLYTVMGRQDLLDTPLCANQNERYKFRDEIDAIVTAWTKTKKSEEILDLLKKADVPCSRFPSFSEVCHDPQLMSRNAIIEVDQLISGKVKVPGSVFKMSKTPGKIDYPAPFLGQDTHEVIAEMLGYTEEDIARLDDEGIL